MRYFLYLQYDGTAYHGWQRQPNAPTVQQTVEEALATILRRTVAITGAGRTDTGVHARLMAAHLDSDTPLDTVQTVYRLNRLLPPDISALRMEAVAADKHARFSATSRTYHYYIHTRKTPFARHYSLETHYALDFEAMNEAAATLLATRDFAAFCKAGADVKTTLCHVSEARWIADSATEWHFRITADRFLRNMVRAVVGTLFDVGRHRLSPGDFRRVIATGSRMAAGDSMPAHALFLEDIRY